MIDFIEKLKFLCQAVVWESLTVNKVSLKGFKYFKRFRQTELDWHFLSHFHSVSPKVETVRNKIAFPLNIGKKVCYNCEDWLDFYSNCLRK